ncbi:hypothetical protein ACQ86N_00280 [Puia sp. P3]|uniref:hypothetical protein n=1 Tax=Puia sp. P3 TaxID=3423952 RepID=UPI003D668F52
MTCRSEIPGITGGALDSHEGRAGTDISAGGPPGDRVQEYRTDTCQIGIGAYISHNGPACWHMRLQLYNITPSLQPYIRLICTMDCDADADTDHIRVLPDTCVELFVNFTSTPVAIIGDQLYKRSIVSSE